MLLECIAWNEPRAFLQHLHLGPVYLTHVFHLSLAHETRFACAVFANSGCGKFQPTNTPIAIMSIHITVSVVLRHHQVRK